MARLNTIQNLRLRYILAISVIALLVTASFITMQRVISEQREFSHIINLASHQSGMANRIAYFVTIMATTTEESEFNIARAQVGRTINKMEEAHRIIRYGDKEIGVQPIQSYELSLIYDDPSVGLERALDNFLSHAHTIYDTEMARLFTGSASILYLSTYGPHALEPLLDAAVEEYERIGRAAILRIEHLEIGIWLATILTLIFELTWIFRPMEKHVHKNLTSLENSISTLKNTRKRLITAQQIALVGDWEFQIDNEIMTWSDQVYFICGVEKDQFTLTLDNYIRLIHPEDRHAVRTLLAGIISNSTTQDIEYRIRRPDGGERLVYQHTVVKYSTTHKCDLIFATIQDITERKELSRRLERLSSHIPGFIFEFQVDTKGRSWFPYASKGIERTCGFTPGSVAGDVRPMRSILNNDDYERLKINIGNSAATLSTWHDQFRVLHPEKGEIWLEGHGSPERLSGGDTLWYGYIWDVTDRKLSEQKIKKLALYDPLTGLANRRLLKSRLTHAIANCQRNRNFSALIMLDLDNFKTINDTKGHNIGDLLLTEVARRLQQCVRETDTISRLGGDEFVLVVDWLGEDYDEASQKAMAIAEKIRVSLSRVYDLGGTDQTHHASASIGVTVFGDNQKNESELLKRADIAMYEAKDLGRNRICLFNDARQVMINKRTEMAHDLQVALGRDEFALYFQPQVTPAGELCGAEALLRWFPPDKETVSPGVFIPIAESTGLIIPLGEWVLERACRYVAELEEIGLPDNFAVAVNISARQFSSDSFLSRTLHIINQSGVSFHRLKFELTETSLVRDMKRASMILGEIRSLGIHIELDDFGTGYSSLNSLKNLPLNTLKLDGSLVRGLDGEASNRAIARAVLAMAKAMSLSVIAEGVETERQKQFLVENGCDILQGYLHGRPMPFGDFAEIIVQLSSFSVDMSKTPVEDSVDRKYGDKLEACVT